MYRALSGIRRGSYAHSASHFLSFPGRFSTSRGIKLTSEAQSPVFQCDEEPNVLGTDQGWGFLPLLPNQYLCNQKYRIVRKLGWGGNSTVWLAHEPLLQRYVAIKALTAHATQKHDTGSLDEIALLERIRSAEPNHPGHRHCSQIIDNFRTASSHGNHICVVTEVLGLDLDQFRMYFPKRRLPVPLVKRVTRQTLLALDYLHQECSIIHTDLKPHNLMLALSEPNATITAELENSPAETYPPRYDKSLSSEAILTVKSQPLQFSALSDDWSDLNIKLGDFGHASWVDRQLRDEIQPLAFRAPETVFGYPWGTPADIWSLGCLTFEHLAGVCLIPLNDAGKLKHGTILDALLARILQTSIDSEYPKDMIDDSSDGKLFFTPEGLLRRVRPGPKTDLAAVLRRFGLPEYEIPPALAFIQRCIRVRPEDRGSAKELLEDPWLHHG